MEDKISVIVPVYNVENYLNSSLNSICNQSYKNIEIILVDDGSSDKSGEICDYWASKDSRIKVFHKPNGGLSSARNKGLDNATGDYISFIDSDDVIHEDFYLKLIEACKSEEADIAVCNFVRVENFDNLPEATETKQNFTVSDEFAKFNQLINERNVVTTIVCNKLFKKEIWDDLRFPINRYQEDEAIIHYVLDKAKRIVYIPQGYYYYLQRPNSIMRQKFNEKSFDKLEAIKDRINFFSNKKDLIYFENYFKFIYCYLNRTLYNQVEKDDINYKKRLNDEFKYYYDMIDKKMLPSKERIKLFVYAHLNGIYRLFK